MKTFVFNVTMHLDSGGHERQTFLCCELFFFYSKDLAFNSGWRYILSFLITFLFAEVVSFVDISFEFIIILRYKYLPKQHYNLPVNTSVFDFWSCNTTSKQSFFSVQQQKFPFEHNNFPVNTSDLWHLYKSCYLIKSS